MITIEEQRQKCFNSILEFMDYTWVDKGTESFLKEFFTYQIADENRRSY